MFMDYFMLDTKFSGYYKLKLVHNDVENKWFFSKLNFNKFILKHSTTIKRECSSSFFGFEIDDIELSDQIIVFIASNFLLKQTYMYGIEEFLIKCEQKYSCNTRKIDSDTVDTIYQYINGEFDISQIDEVSDKILQPVVMLFFYMFQLTANRIINQIHHDDSPEGNLLLELVLGHIFSVNCMEALFPICMALDEDFFFDIEEDNLGIFQNEFEFGSLIIDNSNPIGDRLFGEVAVDFDILEDRVFGKFKPQPIEAHG